jgi:putative transposase
MKDDPTHALRRYQVISAYLADDPGRGQRTAYLDKLAARTWNGPEGPFQVAAETIRSWIRRYRCGGLTALGDKPRPRRGIQALTPETVELVCALKREVPERSLDRLLRIIEGMGKVKAGVVRRSTLHRALQRAGLSARSARTPDTQDLDRFEASNPNDLWQSDMLAGPWLPDPEQPGKMRRAWLYAFLDDHSRMLLHGRWSFKGDLPALEIVFRRALQKYGVPRRVYYDNGATYRSGHMRQIVAELGMHGITFTQTYRPMGHGKIEAFNRLTRAAFVAEVKASKIKTIDALNEAFLAWADLDYGRVKHGETGEAPVERWRAGAARVQWADEERLRLAFLWKEDRKADKAGIFSLFGTEFQVGPALANRRIQIRYDPERLDEVEVWRDGKFAERLRRFEVQAHRRPKSEPLPPTEEAREPAADWLGHLTSQRSAALEPTPKELAQRLLEKRAAEDERVVAGIAGRVDPEVRDDDAVRAWLHRFGPIDAATAIAAVERLVAREGRDQHIDRYLAVLGRGGV